MFIIKTYVWKYFKSILVHYFNILFLQKNLTTNRLFINLTNQKKIKIVTTIGPVTENKSQLTKLIKTGMNIARLNFSHDNFKEHGTRVDNIRKIKKELGLEVAILQDLGRVKIRIGNFENDQIVLKNSQKSELTTKKVIGNEKKVYINYKKLPRKIKVGQIILLNNKTKKLVITKIILKDGIITKVITEGMIHSRRGVNIPNARLNVEALTPKDKSNLKFGVEQDAADVIMIARGNLAVEIPTQEVPHLQKMIIKECRVIGKPVIIVTQMLESIIKIPVPTKTKMADISNAILDKTDTIMLSDKTTIGDFLVEAIKTMSEIAIRTERDLTYKIVKDNEKHTRRTVDAISKSVVITATDINTKYIIALTELDFTARKIAYYRPTDYCFNS